jgi:formate dehydrogenase major subunit
MQVNDLVRGEGKFIITEYIATDEKARPRLPLLLTTAASCRSAILARRRVAPPTRSGTRKICSKSTRTTLEQRGIRDRDWERLASRWARRRCARKSPIGWRRTWSTPRFHHPNTHANVISIIPTGDPLPEIQGHRHQSLAVKRSVALAGGL